MRTIAIILRKEFRQVFRNRAMLPILFVMPVVQLLVLSFAATFEVRETPISIVDLDGSQASRTLVSRLDASPWFEVSTVLGDPEAGLLRGDVGMVLRIPRDLERDLGLGTRPVIQMILDAEDGATAGIVQSYASQVINAHGAALTSRSAGIRIEPRHWFNPNLEYTTFMVPGILVLLVTMIGTFLSAMNVVREKEIGTIEQLNVTPIKRYQFITAKLLPFWVIGMAELAIGLVIARLVFDIPMLGSLWAVFLLAGLYLLVMLGFGLWISTVTETQQQAMFVAWFIMVVFIL
ncbi:MAG: ABC transporter permease, partial [Rhodothermales bacterium]|nr:ABC transporter permease [Rhodothermales bacterium]